MFDRAVVIRCEAYYKQLKDNAATPGGVLTHEEKRKEVDRLLASVPGLADMLGRGVKVAARD